MRIFDQAGWIAATTEPGFVLVRLRPETGLDLVFRAWFQDRAIQLPGGAEREPDLLAVADERGADGPAWLLVFEMQSAHAEEKPKVALHEAATFLLYAQDKERGGGPFRPLPVFVYLKGKSPGVKVVVRTPTGRGLECDPPVWEVAEDSAPEALAKIASGEFPWGALFWIALMRGADEEKVIGLWQRLRDDKAPRDARATLTHVALIFAELAGRRPAWKDIKEGVDMTESVYVNELMEATKL